MYGGVYIICINGLKIKKPYYEVDSLFGMAYEAPLSAVRSVCSCGKFVTSCELYSIRGACPVV